MQNWRVDRIDFVEEENAVCQFCKDDKKRRIRNRIAFILTDGEQELPAGGTCRRKHDDRSKKLIPDFTKCSFEEPTEENENDGRDQNNQGTQRTSNTQEAERETDDRPKLIEYLRLREEKISEFNGIYYKPISEVYERFKSNSLTEEDFNHLRNLMKKCERERKEYSPKNLQACYAYHYWLTEFLEKTNKDDGKKFARSLISQLKNKLLLTHDQIKGANKWFQYIDNMPELDPDAFNTTN